MKFLIIFMACVVNVHAMAESLQENNKARVKDFFELFSKGNPAAFVIVSPNVQWWVPETLAFGGTFKNSKDYFTMLRQNFAGFPTGLALTVTDMVAEGDKVAAEVVSDATHICGEIEGFRYNNRYHFKITLKDGQFVDVKEYNDTKHLNDLYTLMQTPACKAKIQELYKK